MPKQFKIMLLAMGVFCLIAAVLCWNLGYKGFAIFYIVVAIFDFLLSLRKKPISFGMKQPKENPVQRKE